DGGVGPVGAVLDGVNDVGDVLLPLQEAGVAGVFVVGAQRLDEANRREVAAGQGRKEVGLVLQVGGRERVALAVGQPGGAVVVVGQRVVVPLEQGVGGVVGRLLAAVGRVGRRAGQGVVPAAGVPLPVHPRLVEAVADGREVVRLAGVAVVLRR